MRQNKIGAVYSMKISIITVCYNSEKTIRRTIESVLKQKYDEVEYILVDGSSKDPTVAIIEEYEPKFIYRGYQYRYVSEPDKGMYDAMNKGIKMCTGDIIGILNSDDWYEEDALHDVMEAVEKNPHADIYMGAINVLNGNQIIVKHAKDRKYKTSRNFNHPAMFVKKECYKQVGEYGTENVHDDYGWYLKAMKMGQKVCIVDRILTNYPTGGAGSKKSFGNILYRIRTKYQVYRKNGYSKLYIIECFVQEFTKFLLLKENI